MEWKSAWSLSKSELKHNKVPLFFTFLFVALMSWLAGKEIQQFALYSLGKYNFYNHYLVDMLFVVYSFAFGTIFMSSPYLSLSAMKNDQLGKRIAMYRTLPISIESIVLSRMLIMLCILLFMTIFFFSFIFFSLTDSFFQTLPKSLYFAFVLFWLGVALFFNGVNPIAEFGVNTKFLYLYSFLLLILLIAVKILVTWLTEKGFVEWSIYLLLKYEWAAALISLFIGLLSTFAWYALLKKRLLKRDYV
ncbi:hypothetical protein [Bacillus horti]|uniref:ABC transporter permease n=1 Tax=Caldalkalibacillus horti TaxID=77523 RepID=A0ABT9VXN0_9BACI|nr:hypothetical protein [Bacillus horti]MDQ0165375.1 hypothetical protein [Bacillus horti]